MPGDQEESSSAVSGQEVDLECSESEFDLYGEDLEVVPRSGPSDSGTNGAGPVRSATQDLMNVVKQHREETGETSDNGTFLPTVTPKKPPGEMELDPLTPTANMKVLMSAVSPEIRNREKEQEESRKDSVASNVEADVVNRVSNVETNNNCYKVVAVQRGVKRKASQGLEDLEDEDGQVSGRKEKSLGLLCRRFMGKYPEFPNPSENIEICLDAVAKELGVERRRIYDIVNVLESIEIMSRLAKNKYVWHGRTNLLTTLANFKALGIEEGFGEQIEKVKDIQLTRDLQKSCEDDAQADSSVRENLRKDRSLGIMSQRFLMLFLVSKNQAINLDLAAKILVGDPNMDRTANSKFKTQIRRLYDIANILSSLDLIRKVRVTEVRGRKPAFKYVGPTVEDLDHPPPVRECCMAAPSSLLPAPMAVPSLPVCRKPPKLTGLVNGNKNSLRRTMSQQIIRSKGAQQSGKFGRHASFEMMCEIAEGERKRLYYESETEKAVNHSQPSSPQREKQTNSRATRKGDVHKVKQNLIHSLTSDAATSSPVQSGRGVKRVVIVSSAIPAAQSRSNGESSQGLVSTTTDTRQSSQPQSPVVATPVDAKKDQILLRAHLSHPSLPEKQPTLLKLSKAQLESVLKSLSKPSDESNPAVASGEQNQGVATRVVEPEGPATQPVEKSGQNGFLVSPPDVSRARSRKRPLEQDSCGAEECYFDAKRPKKNVESPTADLRRSPQADSEVAAINSSSHAVGKVVNALKSRPSPLRALHLQPEFQPPLEQKSVESGVSGASGPAALGAAEITQTSTPIGATSSVFLNLAVATQTAPAAVSRPNADSTHSQSASPSTFSFGSRGVASLRSDVAPSSAAVQPATYVSASPGAVLSPLVVGPLTPSAVVTTSDYQVTPTSTFVKPTKGIMPSHGARINLVPHLASSGAMQVESGSSAAPVITTLPLTTLSSGRARLITRKLSADRIVALRTQSQVVAMPAVPATAQQPSQIQSLPVASVAQQTQVQSQLISVPMAATSATQTQFFRIAPQAPQLTPTAQGQAASDTVSPSFNNTTPSAPPTTTRSLFQGTPSGSLIRITTHQISPSAFRVVNGQTYTPIGETLAARRLALSVDQTP